jgi:hypothetical protein
MMNPSRLLLAALALSASMPAFAADPTPEQKAQWAKEAEERLHTDWAYLGRYRDANAALPAPVAGQPRIVLIGDSITQGWFDQVPAFFKPGRRRRRCSCAFPPT